MGGGGRSQGENFIWDIIEPEGITFCNERYKWYILIFWQGKTVAILVASFLSKPTWPWTMSLGERPVLFAVKFLSCWWSSGQIINSLHLCKQGRKEIISSFVLALMPILHAGYLLFIYVDKEIILTNIWT